MNKVLSYIIFIISFQSFSYHKILPMEIDKTTDGTTTKKTKITTDLSNQIEEVANQFISLLSSQSGTVILNIFSDRENQEEILQKFLNITNNAEQVIHVFEFLNFLYLNKRLFNQKLILLKTITNELKIAFIDCLKNQIKEDSDLAFELKKIFQNIEANQEELSFENILLIFSDLIGYENVRYVIAQEINSRIPPHPFEELEKWSQNSWCTIL